MKWFIEINEDISGPFTSEEVLKQEQTNSALKTSANVWCTSLNNWLEYQFWKNNLESIQTQILSQTREPLVWFFTENKKSKPKGPFSRTDLLSHLKKIGKKDQVLIWAKGMKNWKTIFAFPEYIEALNISRRQHPRERIDGKITLKDLDGAQYIGNIDIISAGGCGINQVAGLTVNGIYKIEIKSSHFPISLQAEAIVLSSMGNNKWNLKFEKINDETKATIISFLKTKSRPEKIAA